MPISFPSSPSTNDEYTFGSTTWIFNGAGWAVVAPAGAGSRPFLTESLYWDLPPDVLAPINLFETTYV